MAYIGRPSIVGNFVKLDSITAVNGQAAYTMQNNSVNFTDYSTVNQFLVSLNSVIQSPGSSFTVSGSTLTFASNLSTGDVIDFIIVFGNSLSAGVPTDATVSTAKLADNAVTAAKITDSTITAAKLASGVVQNQSAFKNIFINGDMSIAQRGTSITGINSNTYTLDRWITEGDDATITVSQDTTVPTGSDAQGFRTSLKVAVTSALSSVAATDEQKIGQRIEGQMLQTLKYGTSAAESATLSFWVRSNVTGTYAIQFQDDDNDKVQTKTYTISSADTWEKKTVTIAANTSNTLDNDKNRSFRVLWWLTAGSNFTGDNASSGTWTTRSSNLDTIAFGHNVNVMSSTSNTFYLTGCQFEVGSTASDFEFLPVDVNLQRCLRYCYRINGNATDEQQIGGSSWCSTTSRVNHVAEFSPPLRAVPTITSSSDITETLSGTSGMSTGGLFDDNQSGLCNTVGVAIHPASGTPFTLYQTAFPRLANSTSSFIQYDAEL